MSKFFKTKTAETSHSLSVEALEPRLLLSSVQVFAAGETGEEAFRLKVDGEVVAEFYDVGGDFENRQFQVFDYQSTEEISADDIEVEFFNDQWNPVTGFDRNLFVDKIRVDGVVFETENSATFSTGLIDNGQLIGPGFLQTETLNVNGSFRYSEAGATELTTGVRIRIDTLGQEGGERFALIVDGVKIQEFSATNFETDYYYNYPEPVSIEQIQIEFLNDLYDPESGFDRNLTVFRIQLTDQATGESTEFFPDDLYVFSTGVYLEGSGITPGLGLGNTLHANGIFDFSKTLPVIVDPVETAETSVLAFVKPDSAPVFVAETETTRNVANESKSELPTLAGSQILIETL